jgi:hypothetical protein
MYSLYFNLKYSKCNLSLVVRNNRVIFDLFFSFASAYLPPYLIHITKIKHMQGAFYMEVNIRETMHSMLLGLILIDKHRYYDHRSMTVKWRDNIFHF